MKWLVLLVALLGSAAGCRFDANGVDVGDGGGIADGSLVDSGADAVTDGGPPDVPGCVPACTDATHLDTCTAGQPAECVLGCRVIDDAADRCAVLVPSNGATGTQLQGVTTGLTVAANTIVVADTVTGRILNGATVVRAAGPGVVSGIGFFVVGKVGIFAVKTLQVNATGTLTAVGDNSLLLLSAGDVIIRGKVDVSAVCRDSATVSDDFSCGGPGGGSGSNVDRFASGCAAGIDGVSSMGPGPETGGGGGGMHEDGAPGGSSSFMGMPVGGGAGGTVGASCPTDTLVPIGGGSGGGQGGGDVAMPGGPLLFGGQGGGGGGAVQISSFTAITVEKTGGEIGAVLSEGGGGAGGGASFGAGGGGSGGAILLEAPRIVLSGAVVTANGGAGGQGNGTQAGQNGQLTTQRAKGGGGNGDGHGGEGGAATGAPTVGFGNLLGSFDGTGGGGGASGRIRLNVKQLTNSGGTVVSPAASSADPSAG